MLLFYLYIKKKKHNSGYIIQIDCETGNWIIKSIKKKVKIFIFSVREKNKTV